MVLQQNLWTIVKINSVIDNQLSMAHDIEKEFFAK